MDTKLIKHNAGNINLPDDPSYPWKLYVNLSPPEFMRVAFCMMHGGSEEIVVRGMTREALHAFAEEHGLNETHPRYRRMEIIGPGLPEAHVRGKEPVVTQADPVVTPVAPEETPTAFAVVVEEYVKGRHPHADDCDLVVLAPADLHDLAGRVAEKLQFATTGESNLREYEHDGRVAFMVTHA